MPIRRILLSVLIALAAASLAAEGRAGDKVLRQGRRRQRRRTGFRNTPVPIVAPVAVPPASRPFVYCQPLSGGDRDNRFLQP